MLVFFTVNQHEVYVIHQISLKIPMTAMEYMKQLRQYLAVAIFFWRTTHNLFKLSIKIKVVFIAHHFGNFINAIIALL